MAIKLNLLPPENLTPKGIKKVIDVVRGLGVISIAVFIVFTLGLSGFYLVSSATLNKLNSEVDILKSEITAIQKTEQQSVLIKDRLGKIKTVLSQPDVGRSLPAISPYVLGLSGSTVLSELNMDSQKVDFTFIFFSSADLASFLDSISKENNFSLITMTSFSYNPAGGYSVGISGEVK